MVMGKVTDPFEGKGMTVAEFYKYIPHSATVEVKSGFNGRVLCRRFNQNKHAEVGKRKILDIWAEIRTNGCTFSNRAIPIICVYVDGEVEYNATVKKRMKAEGKDDG